MRLAPMMRTIDIVLLVGLIGIVSWTFHVKNESQEALKRVAELEKQLAAERVEIDLLKSDWSLLTSPDRLQKLVERYSSQLGLEGMEASQIANESEISSLRKPIEDLKKPTESHAGIDDGTTTGSINPPIPLQRGAPQ